MSSSRCGLSIDLNFFVMCSSIAIIVHHMFRKLHYLLLGLISYLLLVRVSRKIHGVTWDARILNVNSYWGGSVGMLALFLVSWRLVCYTHSCCLVLLALLSVLMSSYYTHEILFTCEAVLKSILVYNAGAFSEVKKPCIGSRN